MITIVDYGIGNVASVANMLAKNGAESLLTSDAQKIRSAEKLLLPGVGAFDTAMQKLNDLSLIESIREFAQQEKPLLGICLGAQLLMQSSEEGVLQGLGLIKGICKQFGDISPLRVPHMSWSEVAFTINHPLFSFEDQEPRFYFTHSYYMACTDETDIAGTATYGKTFTCAVRHQNIFGVQFHPEKSHRFGARLLQNFASL
jgi:glutamine amidotransferase